MQDKDPLTYSMLTYGWVVLLAIWGGFVNYCTKFRRGLVSRYKLAELIGDIATSAFAGVITFYLCELSGAPQLLTAALVGISGHMGARGVFMIEQLVERRIQRLTGLTMNEDQNFDSK